MYFYLNRFFSQLNQYSSVYMCGYSASTTPSIIQFILIGLNFYHKTCTSYIYNPNDIQRTATIGTMKNTVKKKEKRNSSTLITQSKYLIRIGHPESAERSRVIDRFRPGSCGYNWRYQPVIKQFYNFDTFQSPRGEQVERDLRKFHARAAAP